MRTANFHSCPSGSVESFVALGRDGELSHFASIRPTVFQDDSTELAVQHVIDYR